jgi:hypothetical protein
MLKLKKTEKHPNPSFRRKPDKIAGSDFGQPKAGPKGGIQGCIPQSSILLILLVLIFWTPAFAGVTKHFSTNC